MTRPEDENKISKHIVVFSDICSSTKILEDLIRTENQQLWRNLLIKMKNYLRGKRSSVGFEIYKFLGDGWILLFSETTSGVDLFEFLEELSCKFNSLYKKNIKDVLTTDIKVVGLTFGMDVGSCVKVRMNNADEYIGRPLNVASRLQGAIKQKGGSPQGKVLLSNNLYAGFADRKVLKEEYRVDSVTRTLRNISGGEKYKCKKVWLTE